MTSASFSSAPIALLIWISFESVITQLMGACMAASSLGASHSSSPSSRGVQRGDYTNSSICSSSFVFTRYALALRDELHAYNDFLFAIAKGF